jgi:histidinol-phosphate/aromatic aminotransferase/cobyric acid decarboxylase-like protein
LLAQPVLVELLKRIIPPYAIPTMTIETPCASPTTARTEMSARIDLLSASANGCDAVSSSALASAYTSDATPARALSRRHARALPGRGATAGARFRAYPRLERCLRISIGTPEQNERLLAAVAQA